MPSFILHLFILLWADFLKITLFERCITTFTLLLQALRGRYRAYAVTGCSVASKILVRNGTPTRTLCAFWAGWWPITPPALFELTQHPRYPPHCNDQSALSGDIGILKQLWLCNGLASCPESKEREFESWLTLELWSQLNILKKYHILSLWILWTADFAINVEMVVLTCFQVYFCE